MKKILIIRCGALGDLVYATSVIDALKYEYGEDTIIDFVSTPGSGTLFDLDYRINKVFSSYISNCILLTIILPNIR